MKIIFNYASRSRPQLFRRGVDSIVENANGNYEIYAIVDESDYQLDFYNFANCVPVIGKSLSKVDAINRINKYINTIDYDIIVNMSDDMVFTKKGFDDIIRKSFDNLDQCLHFPDGNRSDLITMSIIGRKFFERFNYIYNPAYISLYCDNEQTEVAQKLGCYKFVNEQIFEHLHPAYNKAHFDHQYKYTESFNEIDRRTYHLRKGLNYGL